MTRNCPAHGFKANELLDIFYNGLTEGTKCYPDSIVGNVFREGPLKKPLNYWTQFLETMKIGKWKRRIRKNYFSKRSQVFLN
jgi:hypothetical protein